jgi:hypothetical protein
MSVSTHNEGEHCINRLLAAILAYPRGGRPEMYLLIRYSAGIILEAVVLAKGTNRLRIAVAGFPDTIELKRSGSQWFTPTREPVEFEFLLADAHQCESVSSLQPACVAKAVGSVAQ